VSKFRDDNEPITESSAVYGNERDEGFTSFFLPGMCDMAMFSRALHVYTNIIKYSIVGNQLVPLLRVVNMDQNGEAFKSGLAGNSFHKSFEKPHYFPVKGRHFTHVEFSLCNSIGERFPFHASYKTIIVLHFIKVK